MLKSKMEKRRIYEYQQKLQREAFSGQKEKCNQWLDCNRDSTKTATVINMFWQMVETRVWKALREMEME